MQVRDFVEPCVQGVSRDHPASEIVLDGFKGDHHALGSLEVDWRGHIVMHAILITRVPTHLDVLEAVLPGGVCPLKLHPIA